MHLLDARFIICIASQMHLEKAPAYVRTEAQQPTAVADFFYVVTHEVRREGDVICSS
jgi:hypothetical protein